MLFSGDSESEMEWSEDASEVAPQDEEMDVSYTMDQEMAAEMRMDAEPIEDTELVIDAQARIVINGRSKIR